MSPFLTLSQVLMTISIVFCLIFDVILLISVMKARFQSGNSAKRGQPTVYIFFMSVFGISGKLANFFMVDAWPIAEMIDPMNGYEAFRQAIGKQISLITTFAYLTPLVLNCLMTIHRVRIFLVPMESKWFSDKRLILYCSTLSILVLISLLIPYYSPCYLNFNSLTSTYVAACAPDRHPLTTFQNKYTIWLPVSSMFVNFAIIFWVKISRKLKMMKVSSLPLTNTFAKRENVMIRQAAVIAAYFSVYELGYLYMRLYSEQFEDWPIELRAISYYCRLFATCSSNFVVYFVETRSTRLLVLEFLGLKRKLVAKKTAMTTVS